MSQHINKNNLTPKNATGLLNNKSAKEGTSKQSQSAEKQNGVKKKLACQNVPTTTSLDVKRQKNANTNPVQQRTAANKNVNTGTVEPNAKVPKKNAIPNAEGAKKQKTTPNLLSKAKPQPTTVNEGLNPLDNILNEIEAFDTANKKKCVKKEAEDELDVEQDQPCSSRQLLQTATPSHPQSSVSYRPLSRAELARQDHENQGGLVQAFLRRDDLMERILAYKMLRGRVESYGTMRQRIELDSCVIPDYEWNPTKIDGALSPFVKPELSAKDDQPINDQPTHHSTTPEQGGANKRGPMTPPGSPDTNGSSSPAGPGRGSNKGDDQQRQERRVKTEIPEPTDEMLKKFGSMTGISAEKITAFLGNDLQKLGNLKMEDLMNTFLMSLKQIAEKRGDANTTGRESSSKMEEAGTSTTPADVKEELHKSNKSVAGGSEAMSTKSSRQMGGGDDDLSGMEAMDISGGRQSSQSGVSFSNGLLPPPPPPPPILANCSDTSMAEMSVLPPLPPPPPPPLSDSNLPVAPQKQPTPVVILSLPPAPPPQPPPVMPPPPCAAGPSSSSSPNFPDRSRQRRPNYKNAGTSSRKPYKRLPRRTTSSTEASSRRPMKRPIPYERGRASAKRGTRWDHREERRPAPPYPAAAAQMAMAHRPVSLLSLNFADGPELAPQARPPCSSSSMEEARPGPRNNSNNKRRPPRRIRESENDAPQSRFVPPPQPPLPAPITMQPTTSSRAQDQQQLNRPNNIGGGGPETAPIMLNMEFIKNTPPPPIPGGIKERIPNQNGGPVGIVPPPPSATAPFAATTPAPRHHPKSLLDMELLTRPTEFPCPPPPPPHHPAHFRPSFPPPPLPPVAPPLPPPPAPRMPSESSVLQTVVQAISGSPRPPAPPPPMPNRPPPMPRASSPPYGKFF